MKQLIKAFARNTVFANIVLLLLFFAGGLAAFLMVRETFPDMSFDMIQITVPYPGADPEEVEEGISKKIEDALEGMEGVKLFTTWSAENQSTASIEVKEGYNVKDVLDRVKSKVDAISTFPEDAEKPVITEETYRDPVIYVSLSGDMSERRLKEWALKTKDEMQQLPDISTVEIFGEREYEINIEISEERLREYGLSHSKVKEAIQKSSLNLAGGTIRTDAEEIRVRTVGRKYTGEDFAGIVLMADASGNMVPLDRVARIRDGFTEDAIQATMDDNPALLLVVFKTKQEDAIVIAEQVKAYVNKKNVQTPEGQHIGVFFDSTTILRGRINLLTKNGIIGLCLVFFILWLFLDLRLSFWGGMGIPVSIAGALAIMWAMGATINMVSLFGMIMVLGIVVDDAIVVGEAIFVQRKKGMPPLQAAVEGVSEVGMPVLAAVITTIIAFLPLAYISGIMGKFIAIIPTVVIACLIISLVECLFLLPAHLSHLPDLNTPTKLNSPFKWINRKTGKSLEYFIDKIYAPFLSKTLRWRYVALCCAFCIFFLTLGLVKGGIVKFETFPELDGFLISAKIEFPNGTPAEVTRKAVDEVNNALIRLGKSKTTHTGEPLIQSRFAVVGQSLEVIPSFGPNYGGIQAIIIDAKHRDIHSKDLMIEWEKLVKDIPGIKSLTFAGMSAGPPGDPIEVWLQSRDMPVILAAADKLIDRLKKIEGVYQVRSDHSPGKNELRFELKPEARALGLTVADLASQLKAAYFGDEAFRLQRGQEDLKVKIRYTAEERGTVSSLREMRIRTSDGSMVPLLSVADVSFSPGYSTIVRTNGMRRVTVSAGVDTKKANAAEIFTELSANFFPALMKEHEGLHISLQGEQKKMRESFGSLMIGFPLALLGMFIIIATMFRSYTQPFVILFAVPFGIIGGILGHLILGFNLSMMSVFGMVALAGVVVNDAIVLIERVNENIAKGEKFFNALISGGCRRFRAIFLTTISTVGGLTPLIMEQDMQAQFLIPMALSIAGGVAFATLLTLVLIPNLLTILNDIRIVGYRLKYGQWPKDREDVEPARSRLEEPYEPVKGEPPILLEPAACKRRKGNEKFNQAGAGHRHARIPQPEYIGK